MGGLLHGIGIGSKILTCGGVHNGFGPGQNLTGSSGVLLARPLLGNARSVEPTVPPKVEQETVTAAVRVLPWAQLGFTRVVASLSSMDWGSAGMSAGPSVPHQAR